jgi:hypothetical protein
VVQQLALNLVARVFVCIYLIGVKEVVYLSKRQANIGVRSVKGQYLVIAVGVVAIWVERNLEHETGITARG